MSSDVILLNEIFLNSITAVNVLSACMLRLKSGEMFDCLFDVMTSYREIANSAQDILTSKQLSIFRQSTGDKAALFLCTLPPLLQSENRAARLLINGCTEGIFDIINCINSCTDAGFTSRNLAYHLIETEQNNISALSRFI